MNLLLFFLFLKILLAEYSGERSINLYIRLKLFYFYIKTFVLFEFCYIHFYFHYSLRTILTMMFFWLYRLALAHRKHRLANYVSHFFYFINKTQLEKNVSYKYK